MHDGSPGTVVASVRARLQVMGRAPTPRPVAGGIVVNRGGQLLLVYSDYVGQGWHFPRGGLDEGETTLDGAIKETQEEGGVEVVGLDVPIINLGPGGTFDETLGFGSPRGHSSVPPNPTCDYFGQVIAVHGGAPPGDVMSQAAFDLLRRAALDAGLAEAEFMARRYELFDALHEVRVLWQQQPVYHVLAFRWRAPERLNGESQRIRWWSFDELAAAIAEGREPIHRAVGRLLPGVREVALGVRGQAEEDG